MKWQLPASVVLMSLFAVFGGEPGAASGPTNTPASATFQDGVGWRITSDGAGAYQEGLDCVRSWFNPSQGNYYFRTSSNTLCDYPLPEPAIQRAVVLDFSVAVPGHEPATCTPLVDSQSNQLNPCSVNTVVDVRLIADALFKSSAVDTPVTLNFDLYPNFTNDTGFQLRFLSRVPFSNASGARTMTAGAASIAELSVRRTSGKRSTLVPIAQYFMPFSMSVAPCPTGGC